MECDKLIICWNLKIFFGLLQVTSGDEIGNSDVDDVDDDDISESTSGPNSMLSQSLRSNNTIHLAGVNQERYFRYKDQESIILTFFATLINSNLTRLTVSLLIKNMRQIHSKYWRVSQVTFSTWKILMTCLYLSQHSRASNWASLGLSSLKVIFPSNKQTLSISVLDPCV